MISKNSSLLIVGDVRPEKISSSEKAARVKEAYKYFHDKNIKAFYNLVDDVSADVGIKLMIQSSGFGLLSPNIVLMGYQANWANGGFESLNTYYKILQ